jgi:hypothetical protein
MKKRLGFVANSSSGDYILDEDDQNEEDTDDYYGWENNPSKHLWYVNEIQFARLLVEIMGQLEPEGYESVILNCASSMNLDSQEVDELFQRADQIWEEAKRRNK